MQVSQMMFWSAHRYSWCGKCKWWPKILQLQRWMIFNRTDSRFAPRQWETALLCNNVSHWLGANLESNSNIFFVACLLFFSVPMVVPIEQTCGIWITQMNGLLLFFWASLPPCFWTRAIKCHDYVQKLCVNIYVYICMYIPYTSSVIGRIYNGSVIQYWRSCTPSRSIRECTVPGLNATFCFLWFTNCVLLFDKNLILGCLWLLVFVLNNILILGIWCSTIPHLPGCFCPWTFFENIRFNTVLTDPFMSHLATQLGYSAGEFQALQLIVLAAFGIVD